MSENLIKTVVWGAAGHAHIVADILATSSVYRNVGFLDDLSPQREGEQFAGGVVLGGRDKLELLREEGVTHIALGIGDCAARLRLADEVLTAGYALATAIHPSAVVAQDVAVGEGSVVCAGAVISTTARLGRAVIVNTSASIDHHCHVEDGAHIAPGVHLPGNVRVGSCTLVGVGSTARTDISIGCNCTIGAGAVIVNDIPDGVVAYGNPAQVVRRQVE